MGSNEALILTVIAVTAAVLLDIAWICLRRHLRSKGKDSAGPFLSEESPADGQPAWTARITGKWLNVKSRWTGAKPSLRRRLQLPLLVLTVLLAAIPSVVVMLDRWADLPWATYLLSKLRSTSPYLMAMPLPAYFVLFFLILLAVGLLIILQPSDPLSFSKPEGNIWPVEEGIPEVQVLISRLLQWIALTGFIAIAAVNLAEQRIPGAELLLAAGCFLVGCLLREYALPPLWRFLKGNRDWLFACMLAHVALVAVITAYHTCPACLPIAIAGLSLAAAHLFPIRRRVPTVYWIFSLGLILFSINVNVWWMSVVGDEFAFYHNARRLADDFTASTVLPRVFDEQGVFDFNPFLATIVQTLFLKMFGTQGFGWRFSNIYLIALAIPLSYSFWKTFLDRRIALLAAFFLASSHFLINFSKIGYVNLQALFLFCASLAAAAWAVRSRRTAAFAVCGVILAMNFYTYGIAIVSIPLALLLLLFFAPPRSRSGLRCWAVMAAGFAILFFPLYLQPGYWSTGFGFTIFRSSQNIPDFASPLQILSYRILMACFSYLYSVNESHFVSVGFVDGISAALVGLGCFAVILRKNKNRFAAFFLVGWVLLLTVAGIIGSPDHPSTTRMFILLPWWVAAAAFGVWWIRGRILAGGAPGSAISRAVTGALLIMVVAINVVNAAVISRIRFAGFQTFESAVQRVAEESQQWIAYTQRRFVFLTTEDYSLTPFFILREVYPQYWANVEMEQIGISGPQLPEGGISLASNANSVFFLMPALPEEWRTGVRNAMEVGGFYRCPVPSPTEKGAMDVFVPKKRLEWCPGGNP
jgi:hypothetical protein